MGDLSVDRHKPPIRFLGGILAVILALTALSWRNTELAAQNGGKKPAEEVEEPNRPKIKPPPSVDDEKGAPKTSPKPSGPDKVKPKPQEEVEEEGKRPRPKVIPMEDEETTPKPGGKPVPRPTEDQPGDLAQALRQTKNPKLQQLYRSVLTPHDVLTMADKDEPYFIEPLQHYYPGERPTIQAEFVRIRPFHVPDRKPESTWEIAGNKARRIVPYELVVLQRVDEFLNQNLDGLTEQDPNYLPRKEMLQAAENVLAAADRFHASARAKEQRKGEEWEPVAEQLRGKLFDVRLKELALEVKGGDWEAAVEQAQRMAEAYPRREDREPIARQMVDLIQQGLKGGESGEVYKEAHNRLQKLEGFLPNSQAGKEVTKVLHEQFQSLLDLAKKLRDDGKPQEAWEKMRLAQEIWPGGPRDEWLRLNHVYPILRVGVTDLPVKLLPGLAATDVEHQAVELMFESLIRLRGEPDQGQHYEPVLVDRLPPPVPLGREFRLIRNASWSGSDTKPITAADIAATVRGLCDPNRPGSMPSLGKLLVEKPELGGDPFRIYLQLKQGYLDPLSLMTFKILPLHMSNQNGLPQPPIGSGPFQFEEQTTLADGHKVVRFVANPNYASRENKGGLPHIREVQFLQMVAPEDDPVKALAEGKIDLIPNLPAASVKDLSSNREVTVIGPLRTRRVYFLAVNHRRPLLQNRDLRRALANAIDREQILKVYFRGDRDKEVHRPLNGPFPAGSWACDTSGSIRPYTSGRARAFIHSAGKKDDDPPWRLTLKYPKGEPGVAAAMKYLCTQVRNAIKVELQPDEVEADQYREVVEERHDYDLAYYHYDYVSDVYWLWPLFDPNEIRAGGSNYLGYDNIDLQSQLGQAMSYRDFGQVQKTMQLIHHTLDREMPLIPLWQLDVYMAHRRELTLTSPDPLLVFTDVEQWKKELKK